MASHMENYLNYVCLCVREHNTIRIWVIVRASQNILRCTQTHFLEDAPAKPSMCGSRSVADRVHIEKVSRAQAMLR